MKKPMVYLGDTGKLSFKEEIDRLGWGNVIVGSISNSIYQRPFFLDNGAFIAGRKGLKWEEDDFLNLVDEVVRINIIPDFVVLPDIVGGGKESLDLSLSWIDRLPSDWPKALASQDGQTPQELIQAMSDPSISVWFLGGHDSHKLHAHDYCDLAHRLDRKFHFARCSTLERLDWAIFMGVDSLDTAFPLWTKLRFNQFIDVWENGHPQYKLIGRE